MSVRTPISLQTVCIRWFISGIKLPTLSFVYFFNAVVFCRLTMTVVELNVQHDGLLFVSTHSWLVIVLCFWNAGRPQTSQGWNYLVVHTKHVHRVDTGHPSSHCVVHTIYKTDSPQLASHLGPTNNKNSIVNNELLQLFCYSCMRITTGVLASFWNSRIIS